MKRKSKIEKIQYLNPIDKALSLVELLLDKYANIRNVILGYVGIVTVSSLLFLFYSTYNYTNQLISYIDFQVDIVIGLVFISSAFTIMICYCLISLTKEENSSSLINK